MTKTDRRDFIKRSSFVAGALTIGAVSARPAAAAPEKQDEDYWVADLGKIKDLNEKNPLLVKAQFKDSEGTVVAEEKVYVRWESGQNYGRWVVLSAICQHLKCKVDFSADEHKFICPCHGSQYDIDGKVIKRPSRKDLPDYSEMVDEEDGRLKLKRLPD